MKCFPSATFLGHCHCPRAEDRVGVGGAGQRPVAQSVAVKYNFLEICVTANKDREILHSTICSCLHNIKMF